ncbi:MAG TPA: tetratricopeptide repeat protein [Anaerolineae bacterium]|nr:tetratricopeptide repeat protein [Anaerolineae bacterium]
MSKTPLREYIQEIEQLIESGDSDIAIFHCRYILNKYPKNINTHRLLAKSMLGKQEYQSAELIFKQVLSVFPDDLVAHIGLSFISEISNNLDIALNHMERAFEVQPANPLMKEEMKRIYLKRDGFEPSKIRLTRGALIRMYSQSNLYSQAIAEIRIGLHEHPNRLDFKVELARMLYLNKDKIEAVDTCIKIISNFPYCFEANKILYKALPDTSDSSDVRIFKQRLIAIDPYYLFVTKNIPDIRNVPDVAIMIEHAEPTKEVENLAMLDWKSELNKYWQEPLEWTSELDEDSEIDWEAILEKNFNVDKQKVVKELSKEKEREIGIVQQEKQKGVAQALKDTQPIPVTTEAIEPSNSDIHLQEEEEIPSWIFENSKEITETSQSDSSQEKEEETPSWILEDSKGKKQAKEKVESDSTQKIEKEPIKEKLNVPLPSEIEGGETPLDEIGMIDHDAPVTTELRGDESAAPSIWLKDDEETVEQESPAIKSDNDVAAVEIQEDQTITLIKANKALQDGDINLAFKYYQALLQEEDFLTNIVFDMKNALINYGEEPLIWLILGEAYSRQGQTEKALGAFRNAEKKTSL